MISLGISIRRTLVLAVLCLAGMLIMAGCTPPWQHSNPVIASGLSSKPTAQQILQAVQKDFHAVTSFHVTMKTDNLGAPGSGQIQIRSADGDVLMPDKVKAQANVLLSGQAVTVNLISVGSVQYITDPITGQWRVVKGILDPRTLTNPDTGIVSLAGKLQNVTGPTDDTVGGTPCWRVNGVLNAKFLTFLTGGGVPAGTMLKTSICAGKADGLPYDVSIIGQAAHGDTPQTARSFLISKYNENLSITAPQV